MRPRRNLGTTTRKTTKAGEESARRLTAQRLTTHLQREDPVTSSLEIARMWEQAYTELVDFEENVLSGVRRRMPFLSEPARHEAELTNVPMIVDHLQTFKYRLAFWTERRLKLEQQPSRRS